MYKRGEIVASFWCPHFGDKMCGVHQGAFDDNDEKDVSSDEPRDHENGKGHITKGI